MDNFTFDEISTALREVGVFSARQRGDRLACSRSGGDWGLGGGLWIADVGGRWFISTWTPHIYAVPADLPLGLLVRCIVDALDSAPEPFYDFSPDVKTKYDLNEVTPNDYDRQCRFG